MFNIPVEATLEVIGGKWKKLRELEEDGVVKRRIYEQNKWLKLPKLKPWRLND